MNPPVNTHHSKRVAASPSDASERRPVSFTEETETTDQPEQGCHWDKEFLREVAWDISERKPAEAFTPAGNHVALAMVHPCRGFAHWRISHEWIEETRRRREDAWNGCQMVLRLYDVSYITFDGLNANHIQDLPLPCIRGQMFFDLSHAGTWQLGEVGFLLCTGEFIPAARSHAVSFPRSSTSSHGAQDALLVEEGFAIEAITNLWDQENILKERRTPKLRHPLRVAILCMTLDASGMPEFVVKLATGLAESGHEVHLLGRAVDDTDACRALQGVQYHSLDIPPAGTPLDAANAFRKLAEQRLAELPSFDVVHIHEWLSGAALPSVDAAKICSLTSLETTRLNGAQPTVLSTDIEQAEREVASAVDVVLVPGWLREKAVRQLRLDGAHVHSFAMEGRLPNEWDCPCDFGQIKGEIHVGPMDRLILFIGPLEHAAGPDLLIEAVPTILNRVPNLRVAFAGAGECLGGLQQRAAQLGIEHAVRFLGHVDRHQICRLLRASEALALPSRYRIPFDDAVIDLARLAGRPVITTHGGPAHMVRHEETGVITYDNPGSMVWALDRILSDPAHARRMGENGRRDENHTVSWNEVARRYLELCASSCPGLSTMPSRDKTPVLNSHNQHTLV
ncbi:MAG: glycosyltransferase [Pirellulales bacterium]|nr:glycosyltransferase [Pirellulales bacterium]